VAPGAALVVIAKSPAPGRSKTRLCPPCTPRQAAELAEAALEDTLQAVAATPARRRLLVLDGDPVRWLARGFEVHRQREGGLGERLAHALGLAGGPALVVGMDTPQLAPGLLEVAARRLLEPDVDAVLGPAQDGGYWTIGLRSPDRRVFQSVPMSTPGTGRAQRRRLMSLGLRVAGLPMLRDVDTFADAVEVARLAPETRFARAVGGLSGRHPPHQEETVAKAPAGARLELPYR
jgi:rSAM/selenodomain-associated transferase 1